MNYRQTLDYLFTHLPMYQRIGPAAYKKDLTNTLTLCEVLGNPQHKFSSIHVAGTNGKGSVSNMLASVFTEAGYSTGLYTSPHLVDFRERIRVNGKLCDQDFIVGFVERIKPHIEVIQPSFFEITVVMAFDYFVQKEIDIAIIEVGLGGRLDSTNVITPVLSVITNISYDHQQMLGNTLAEIAGEKAGIIKSHVPVVIGEFHPETFPVFQQKALEQHASLYTANENVQLEIVENTLERLEVHAGYLNQLIYPDLVSGLTGDYQMDNLKTVIQSIEVLRENKIEINDEAVYEGIKNVVKNTGFAGRFQLIAKQPLVICDCAHNSDGLQKLFQQIRKINFSDLHIVTGMVNDKDIEAGLAQFPTDAVYYFSRPDVPRGLDAEKLSETAARFHLRGNTYNSVKTALTAAQQVAKPDDLILICGSIFVAAEALEFFKISS